MVTPSKMILDRRYGRPHSNQEISEWIAAFTAGTVPDYQMAAWLMACCFNPLSKSETAALTAAMVDSGVRLSWKDDQQLLVDKHSTGGVGDKVSIILAPLVACFGLGVPMMAGRGLGHTGGTIDKLESIPGYNANLEVADFQEVVRKVGVAITTTGPHLCPADKKLYALRDVTGTVSSVPLQTSSIMCKKIAENPQSLVLDVKYGQGSFQETEAGAKELAESMVATGIGNGLRTTAFLTNMDHPLGCTVGNWLEIYECIQVMRGDFDKKTDLVILVVMQAVEMLVLSGKFDESSRDELVVRCLKALSDGSALSKFREMIVAQGGDATYVDQADDKYKDATCVSGTVVATSSGFVSNIHALEVGLIGVELGAGRKVVEDPVDPIAGIQFNVKVGDKVKKGDVIAVVYSRHSDVVDYAVQRLQACVEYSQEAVNVPEIVTSKITQKGLEPVTIPEALRKLAS